MKCLVQLDMWWCVVVLVALMCRTPPSCVVSVLCLLCLVVYWCGAVRCGTVLSSVLWHNLSLTLPLPKANLAKTRRLPNPALSNET